MTATCRKNIVVLIAKKNTFFVSIRFSSALVSLFFIHTQTHTPRQIYTRTQASNLYNTTKTWKIFDVRLSFAFFFFCLTIKKETGKKFRCLSMLILWIYSHFSRKNRIFSWGKNLTWIRKNVQKAHAHECTYKLKQQDETNRSTFSRTVCIYIFTHKFGTFVLQGRFFPRPTRKRESTFILNFPDWITEFSQEFPRGSETKLNKIVIEKFVWKRQKAWMTSRRRTKKKNCTLCIDTIVCRISGNHTNE